MARPNGSTYAGRAVVDDLERESVRARLKRFLVTVIDAKGPKTVARDLTSRGWPYEEGTVRTWRGTKNPPPDVVFALAALYATSLDEYATGQALEARFVDQLADHSRRLDRIEARLQGWEIEMASAAGREPPADTGAGAPLSLEQAAWRRRVEDLERVVETLRQQQA